VDAAFVWRFTEHAGYVDDETGRLEMQLTFPTWTNTSAPAATTGSLCAAYTDTVKVADAPILAFGADSFSVNYWWKFPGTNLQGGIGKKENWKGWALGRLNNQNNLSFQVGDGTNWTVLSKAINADGQWHMITGVRSTGVWMRLFMDAQLEASATDTCRSVSSAAALASIGYNQSGISPQFDDLRLHRRAWSGLEISNLFLYGAAPATNDLVAFWSFTNAFDLAVFDNSGNMCWGDPQVGTSGEPLYVKATNGCTPYYVLDGAWDYFVINSNRLNYHYSNSFSFFAWHKPTTSGLAQAGVYLDKTDTRGYSFQHVNTANLRATLVSGSYTLRRETTNVVANTNWHLVGFTYDGSSTLGGLKIYLDGAECAYNAARNLSTLGTNDIANAKSAFVGHPSAGSSAIEGGLYRPAMYSKVLSSTDVLALYQQTHPTNNLERVIRSGTLFQF
jgi:hypothetical protein